MTILSFDEFIALVDTTDKSQREKYNKIYVDIEETYIKNLLTTAVYDKVKDGTYTPTTNPAFFKLLKKCTAKKIETVFIKTGSSQLTPLGLIQRNSEYSTQSEIGQVKMKLDAVFEILRSYEEQLLDELENIEEYVSPLEPKSTQAPFRISATDSVSNQYQSPNYYQECLCKKDTGHYPAN